MRVFNSYALTSPSEGDIFVTHFVGARLKKRARTENGVSWELHLFSPLFTKPMERND